MWRDPAPDDDPADHPADHPAARYYDAATDWAGAAYAEARHYDADPPRGHVISDIRLRGPTATWVRCTCGRRFRQATAEGLATAYANHTSGQTYEEVLEQLEAAEEYEELVEAWR